MHEMQYPYMDKHNMKAYDAGDPEKSAAEGIMKDFTNHLLSSLNAAMIPMDRRSSSDGVAEPAADDASSAAAAASVPAPVPGAPRLMPLCGWRAQLSQEEEGGVEMITQVNEKEVMLVVQYALMAKAQTVYDELHFGPSDDRRLNIH